VVFCFCATVFTLAAFNGYAGVSLTVAVAANAAPALEDIAKKYQQKTGVAVVVSSGATGLLARQIREGAPFDLFVSADMVTVQKLAEQNLLTSNSVQAYARGRLVFWQQPRGRAPIHDIADLASTTASRIRIAIANPETAPYGQAAKEALEHLHAWQQLKDRIIIAVSYTI
jgi:molybdate transport system substrate-binding protein